MSEEPDMTNTTLDNGRSLRQLISVNSLKCNEQTNTNTKLAEASSVIKCGVWFLTHIDKPFFPHFRKFSKHLPDFKHSYLSQMTTKN